MIMNIQSVKVRIVIALLCLVAQGAWAQDPTVVTTESELRDAIANGANIQFANDIVINALIAVEDNKTVTIDLGGHTLNRGCTGRGSQAIVVAAGSTLTLSNGTVTGGWGGKGGALNNEGTAVLENVIITGSHADNRGGGISNYGALTMTGGAITDNTCYDQSGDEKNGGGGLFNRAGATATLSGVTITGNEAKVAGGGAINNWGTLTLDGCTITGNTSKNNGGGIWNGSGSKLNMQGKNTVTDNNGQANADNVYLTKGIVITVTGSLEGSQIGVSMQTPDVFTSGFGANNDKATVTCFLSDNSDYKIVESDNEAKLVKDMETGIETVADGRGRTSDVWYDLSGRKIDSKPSVRGIYIVNGKKVLR